MLKVEIDKQMAEHQYRAFSRLMFNDPDTRKRIRKILSEELKDAAKRLREDAEYALENDPRQAHRAVKSKLLRDILAGKVGIMNPRRRGAPHSYEKPRLLDQTRGYQRGGNRLPRSEKTERMDSYYGADRAFVLRFLNNGTKVRKTRFGNRGAITANHWFENMAPHEIELAVENLCNVIDEEIAELYANEINN